MLAFADRSPVLAGIIGTVVGGLILALILWMASRIPRQGRPIRKFFGWVISIRLTTTSRLAAVRAERDEELADVQSKRYELTREFTLAQQKIKDLEYEKLNLVGKLAVAKNGVPGGKSKDAVRSLPRAAAATPPTPDTPRMPPPRWSIRRKSKDDPKVYVLINWEPASRATNIRLDAPPEMFDFHDKARWDELEYMGEYSRDYFSGHVKGSGRSDGVMFTVTWLDSDSSEQTAQVHLERPPRQPIVVG